MRSSFLALALTALFVTAACAQNETQPSASDLIQGTTASELAPGQALPMTYSQGTMMESAPMMMESAPMMMGNNCCCASYTAPMRRTGMIRRVGYQQPIAQQPYVQPSYSQAYAQPRMTTSPCGCGQSIQGQQVSTIINAPTTTVSTPIYQDPAQEPIAQDAGQSVAQPCCGEPVATSCCDPCDPCCCQARRGFRGRMFRRYR